MKIITLCGSLKFQKEMMEIAEKVALDGNCILTPVYPVLDNIKRTEEQLVKLKAVVTNKNFFVGKLILLIFIFLTFFTLQYFQALQLVCFLKKAHKVPILLYFQI